MFIYFQVDWKICRKGSIFILHIRFIIAKHCFILAKYNKNKNLFPLVLRMQKKYITFASVMHFTDSTSIFNLIMLGIHVFVQLAAAILIYVKQRDPQDRSWRYIFLFFIVSAIASTVEIVLITRHGFDPQSYKLLDPLINITGFYIFALLLCYII